MVDLKAEKTDLNNLLGIPGMQYQVPEFQRPYAWGDQQIDQLWDDLVGSLDGRHFLGSVVLNTDNAKKPQVIDGQQRLTTLVILLALIRDKYVELESAYAGQPEQLLRNTFIHGDQAYKFKSGNANWFVFRDYVLRSPGDPLRKNLDDGGSLGKIEKVRNKRLIANIRRLNRHLDDFLSERSNSEAALLQLEQHIRLGIDLVAIRVGSIADAFLLFETLNDRGLQLSAADLLKSHLLSKVAQAEHSESVVHDASIQWDDMIDRLGGVDVTRFLRHYLLMSRPKVRKDDVFEFFKEDVQAHGAVALLARLHDYARHYGDLLDASRNTDPAVQKAIRDLNGLNSVSHFILLLPAKAELDPGSFVRLCRLSEILSFRWIVAGQNAQVLESIYAKAARMLDESNGSQLLEVEDLLMQEMPDSTTFTERFRSMTMGVRYVTRYILRRMEESRHTNVEIEVMGPGEVHIEHIMPQTATEYWESAFSGDPDDYDEMVSRFGNLTLLHQKPNQQISNGDFPTKKAYYAESKIKLTTDLVALDEWTGSEIEQRQAWMALLADHVWSVASLDVTSWMPPPFPASSRSDAD